MVRFGEVISIVLNTFGDPIICNFEYTCYIAVHVHTPVSFFGILRHTLLQFSGINQIL